MKILTFLLSLTNPRVASGFKTNHIVMNDGFNHLYRAPHNTFDVLYQQPTITPRFIKNKVFENCGFYQGPSMCLLYPETHELLYQPPGKSEAYEKNTYTNCGFYQGR